MKKYLLIAAILVTVSCANIYGKYCADPSEYDRNLAQSYYDSFGTWKIIDNAEKERLAKLFGCNYRRGDAVYSYSTFWGKKYILVRYGRAVTYIDEK